LYVDEIIILAFGELATEHVVARVCDSS